MRINLVTPFSEKDDVKALGARWDPVKKIWYITNVTDLDPFLRWIPDVEAATANARGGVTRAEANAYRAPIKELKGPVTGSAIEVPYCGCDVLPWEDCVHTAKL